MIAKVGSKEVFFDLPFENDPKITNSILTINDAYGAGNKLTGWMINVNPIEYD